MKKSILYIVGLILLFGIPIPFIEQASAQKNIINASSTSDKVPTPTINQNQLTAAQTLTSPWTTKTGVQSAPIPAVLTTASAANEVNVSTWDALTAAMKNKDINVIHIQSDFYNPATLLGNSVLVDIPMRSIKINGNGFTVDFGATTFTNNIMSTNLQIKWEINHLTIYGRSNFGVMSSTGIVPSTSSAHMTFNNVSYVGSKINSNFFWSTAFQGHIESHSVNSYISPFTSNTLYTVPNGTNLQVTDVVFSKNSYYHGTTENAGVFVLLTDGKMVAEENSEVILSAGGDGILAEYGNDLMNILGKSVQLDKNSNVTLNTKVAGSMRAIALSSNSTITVNDGAKLNINGRGPSLTFHLIDLASSSKIDIKKDAQLNIQSINKGIGTGDLINARSNAEFLIGKNATFNAVSDGTGIHNILDFGGKSLFQFADAKKVNLQFTNDSISNSARLLSMFGSDNTLDVNIQDVKAWNRGSGLYSTNNTRTPEFHWTPMFGMKTQITTLDSTVLEVNTLLNSVKANYSANFKPERFSRLLYSYIDDVQVAFQNIPTDNINAANSKVIKGVTSPGAYVRLTGDPALPNPSVPSGIDAFVDAKITSNYTVIADHLGEFTVAAKAGQTFTASNTITAYAFKNGKDASATINVVDETPPTANGVNLTIASTESLPNASSFIRNPQDSNPSNSGFTYHFKEDYAHLTEQQGQHPLVIIISDTAGNTAEIPAELTVIKERYGIKADDFSIKLSDLKTYDTTNKLHALLLQQSNANGFGIFNHELTDVTAHLSVTNSNLINQMKAGKYTITLSFDLSTTQPGAIATKTFVVTVLNDEAIKPTNPENPGQGDPIEKENDGTGHTGLLKLDYAPSQFNFGEVKFGFRNIKVNALKTTSSKQWLQVSDTRADEDISNWSVQVVQQKEWTSENGKVLQGARLQIPAGQLYNEQTGEVAITTGQLRASPVEITTTPQRIFQADNSNEKMKNTSTSVWNVEDVTLSIPGEQEIAFENYTNAITWTLVIEP